MTFGVPPPFNPYRLHYDHSGPVIFPADDGFDDLSDEQLIEKIKTGDSDIKRNAKHAIYNRYAQNTFDYLKKKCRDVEDAEDIAAKTWIIALSKLNKFEWEGTPIGNWIISIAFRAHRQHFQSSGSPESILLDEELLEQKAIVYLESYLLEDASEEPTQAVANKAGEILQPALQQLKERDRTIVTLIYYRGMNSTQVAEKLNMKPGTVRVALKRALDALKKILL